MIGITIPIAIFDTGDIEPGAEDYFPTASFTSELLVWLELLIASGNVPICLC